MATIVRTIMTYKSNCNNDGNDIVIVLMGNKDKLIVLMTCKSNNDIVREFKMH